MDLVGRAKGMVLTPAQEWSAVAGESTDTMTLIQGYVAPLAGLAAIGSLLGSLILGGGFVRSIVLAIMSFILAIVAVFVLAKIAELLAPTFGGPQDGAASMKLAAHAPTSAWIGGFLSFIPVIGWIAALVGGLYSLYVIYLGVSPVMRVPDDKSLVYTICIIVAAVVVQMVLGMLAAMIAFRF